MRHYCKGISSSSSSSSQCSLLAALERLLGGQESSVEILKGKAWLLEAELTQSRMQDAEIPNGSAA